MVNSVSDRYRKAERQRLGGIPGLSQAMAPPQQGSSPLLGSQMMQMLATVARDKPVAVDPATAKAKWEQALPPFSGARNEQALPAFEQPGGSLPIENYMPQAMTDPHQVAGAPLPAPAPQMTQPQQPVAPMAMTTEPVPQNLGDPAIAALMQALTKKKMEPWAINEGNYNDQYGG